MTRTVVRLVFLLPLAPLDFPSAPQKRRRLSDMLLHVRFLHDAVHLLGALRT